MDNNCYLCGKKLIYAEPFIRIKSVHKWTLMTNNGKNMEEVKSYLAPSRNDAVYASQDTKLLLAELGSLKDGWDGEKSVAISPKVLTFVGSVLADLDANLLKDWVLFPDARGYIYMDYTRGKDIAGITVAEDKMSAFDKKNGELRKYSFDELNEQKLISILEEVYE